MALGNLSIKVNADIPVCSDELIRLLGLTRIIVGIIGELAGIVDCKLTRHCALSPSEESCREQSAVSNSQTVAGYTAVGDDRLGGVGAADAQQNVTDARVSVIGSVEINAFKFRRIQVGRSGINDYPDVGRGLLQSKRSTVG